MVAVAEVLNELVQNAVAQNTVALNPLVQDLLVQMDVICNFHLTIVNLNQLFSILGLRSTIIRCFL